ncbi:MAG: metal-binding protein [Burkholderiales bacterium]|nr:metal-binding protein [Burkholderiales bacterium]
MHRRIVLGAVLLLAHLLAPLVGHAAEPVVALPAVVVYAPSPCLACIDWADHLRQNGFVVTIEEKLQADMPKIKRWLNVPSKLESVHTAKIGRYFVEGHVPAEDILLLLKEQPRARGLAVPGLPRGAPGRESYNPICDTACTILDNASGQPKEIRREAFNTMLVGMDGRTSVYARH